jgi:hypothetical protein
MISGGTRDTSIGELRKIDKGAVAVAGRNDSGEKPIIRMRERPFKMWQWYLNPSGKLRGNSFKLCELDIGSSVAIFTRSGSAATAMSSAMPARLYL